MANIDTSKDTSEDVGDFSLKVASLNCWGLYISKKRKLRFSHIARYFIDCPAPFDLVAFQEIWVRKDYERLVESLKPRYPHAVYFPSGVVGSGLAIFSRFPIKNSFFRRFSLGGSPEKIWQGDWFSGKGVGGVRIVVKNKINVDFYTTHLQAEYGKNKNAYLAHRLIQLQEVCQFIESTSRPSHVVIVAGDLNVREGDLAYRMMIDEGMANRLDEPLKDSWRELNPVKSVDSISDGATMNLPKNTFTKKGKIPQRIDYIMYSPRPGVRCENFNILTDDAPYDHKVSLSDHSLVSATFSVQLQSLLEYKDEDFTTRPIKNLPLRRATIEEATSVVSRKKRSVEKWQKFHYSVVVLMILLFIGLTIACAVTIPNNQLPPLIILTLFGIQPALIVTAFLSIIMAKLWLQEERAALSSFIGEWNLWLLQNEVGPENILITNE